LIKIKELLENNNVYFDEPGSKTVKVYSYGEESDFYTLPFLSLFSVKVKKPGIIEEIVLTSDDYSLLEHTRWSKKLGVNVYNQIVLNQYSLASGLYLELTGVFGVTEDVPDTIRAAVIDYINKYENYSMSVGSSNGQIKKSKTGEVEVEFQINEKIDRTVTSSVEDDEELIAELSKYYI
jgi:hypothetical protein